MAEIVNGKDLDKAKKDFIKDSVKEVSKEVTKEVAKEPVKEPVKESVKEQHIQEQPIQEPVKQNPVNHMVTQQPFRPAVKRTGRLASRRGEKVTIIDSQNHGYSVDYKKYINNKIGDIVEF